MGTSDPFNRLSPHWTPGGRQFERKRGGLPQVLDLEVFDRVSLLLVQEPGESCAVIGGKTGAQLAQAAVFRPVVFIVIRTVNRPMLELFPTEGLRGTVVGPLIASSIHLWTAVPNCWGVS